MQCTFCAEAPCARCASSTSAAPSPLTSPRVHAHARGGTRMLDSIGEPREPYLCVPVLLCVTRIIRTLAPQPSRHLSSDLDKSKIAVAEVKPRIPHLSPFHFRESRAAKSRCCRVIVAPRGVAQFKSIGSRPAAARASVGQYTTLERGNSLSVFAKSLSP